MPAPVARTPKRRRLSPKGAVAVMVAAVVIVGGVGYVVLNAIPTTTQSTGPHTSCAVPNPCCCSEGNTHDLILWTPFLPGIGQWMASLEKGQSLPATVSLSGGEAADNFTVYWGDGTNSNQTSPSFTHIYHGLGTYVVYATALVHNTTHTGYTYLVPLSVTPTLPDTSNGEFPTLTTTFSNGSAPGVYPWVSGSGSVRVSAEYSKLPTAAGYVALSPRIVSTGGNPISNVNNSTGANATYSFGSPGDYRITLVGPVAGPSGTVYQNYTWDVLVGPNGTTLGSQSVRSCGCGSSPHTGSLYIYEIVPGGATSLDPAVDYETTGGEIIQNVYETLVQYAGDSTASFVPVLSMRVPGPAASGPGSCQAQYGTDLQTGNYWTFPINPNASFYDPGTGASWGVYPSDVMFSVARTLMWLETPSQYVTNGWIIGQSLLPYGQGSFDGGLHTPWNNTPQNVYGAFLVNNTKYCPAAARMYAHGCITFDAVGSGTVWPQILEFLENSEGASVVPCGWFTSLGAGLPGFTTHAAHGDGPCLLPGGGTTTNATAFTSYVSSASPTLFDPIIALDATNIYQPQPQVRWKIVGSGPYYLNSVDQGQGYILKANPAYTQPNCAGLPGCYAAANGYASTVNVFWDQNSVTGVEQYIAGQSDLSTFFPTDIPTILNLVHAGKINLYTQPTLNLFPVGFAFHFDPAATQNDSGLITNIPGDFFSYIGMREFLAQTFPYGSFINVFNKVDGIPFIQGEGGAIPQYLDDSYPANISWPGLNTSSGLWPQVWQDPNPNSSAVGSPSWWWSQITNSTSPWFDPEAAACGHPEACQFPIGSQLGDPPFDQAVDLWSLIVKGITGNAIQPSRADCWECGQIVVDLGETPGTGPVTMQVDGWLPDYPDPTDYTVPFYYPDSTYTYTAALNETLVQGEWGNYYNGCAENSAATFANLIFWANARPLVPQSCQGTAYSVMTWAMHAAAVMPVGPERTLYYNLVEHIANGLALYVYVEQQVGLGSYASWIDPAGIDTNPMTPGQLWFQWMGNGTY
ncbi:MAG: hypothetical protein ACLP8Y_07215 [Thermoplasmata archaeon]